MLVFPEKAEVKELTRDEAIILMVESSLQRSKILPSEKAYSYKMKLEAMKRQGQRTDLTSSPVEMKSSGKQSLDLIGETAGDSRNQVHRYIRLTELQPNILEMVDEGKIAFRPAVEISYLTKPEQAQLYEVMQSELATPSLSQAIKLKDFSKNGRLNEDVIFSIMSEEKPNQREKYVIKADTLKRYIPDNIPYNKTEDYIIKALDFYQRHMNRQRGMER